MVESSQNKDDGCSFQGSTGKAVHITLLEGYN